MFDRHKQKLLSVRELEGVFEVRECPCCAGEAGQVVVRHLRAAGTGGHKMAWSVNSASEVVVRQSALRNAPKTRVAQCS